MAPFWSNIERKQKILLIKVLNCENKWMIDTLANESYSNFWGVFCFLLDTGASSLLERTAEAQCAQVQTCFVAMRST